MSTYGLPTSVEIGGAEYEIRSDFRAVLDICGALGDPELSEDERGMVVLDIFYPSLGDIPPDDYREAIEQCFWFINCGEKQSNKRSPKLIDWEHDFQHIVGPVNRIIGHEVRADEYLHWWTFISAYYEIGECLFSQIVKIRSLKAARKPLDKSDREWYRKNRELVDFKQGFTDAEKETLKAWGV